MRSLVGWVLLIAGIVIAALGIGDAAFAWLSQYHAPVATSEREVLPSGFVAKLELEQLNRSLYVVDAKKASDLRRGPGYIAGSVRPGERGNCIIAGHRDLHFRILKDIRAGDDIEIVTAGGRYRYRVATTRVVDANDRSALRPVYSQQLTLVTCFPFYFVGPAPRRFVVTAYRSEQS